MKRRGVAVSLTGEKVTGWQRPDSGCSGRKQASREKEMQRRADEADQDSAANGLGRCRGRGKLRQEGRALPWSAGTAWCSSGADRGTGTACARCLAGENEQRLGGSGGSRKRERGRGCQVGPTVERGGRER
jgi:hypothetical protein